MVVVEEVKDAVAVEVGEDGGGLVVRWQGHVVRREEALVGAESLRSHIGEPVVTMGWVRVVWWACMAQGVWTARGAGSQRWRLAAHVPP